MPNQQNNQNQTQTQNEHSRKRSYEEYSESTVNLSKPNPKARQTNNSQTSGLLPAVDNPERLLSRRRNSGARPRQNRLNIDNQNRNPLSATASGAGTVRFSVPVVSSPTDVEANPFYVPTSEETSQLKIPGQFRVPDASVYHSLPTSPVAPEQTSPQASSSNSQASSSNPIQGNPVPPTTQNPNSAQNMPSAPHMPVPFSQGAPKWDGEIEKLGDFIWHLEHQFEVSNVTDAVEKLRWILSYVSKGIRDEWSSFQEYIDKDWKAFMERLKIEYPELVTEETGSVSKLKSICRKFRTIGLADRDDFSSFR